MLFFNFGSLCPCWLKCLENPITQHLFLSWEFCFKAHPWCQSWSRQKSLNPLSGQKKNNHCRLISCPFQIYFESVISINKQKYVNTPPRTPFSFLFIKSSYPHNSIQLLSNCANLYLHIKGTKNSLEQQGYENSSAIEISKNEPCFNNLSETKLNIFFHFLVPRFTKSIVKLILWLEPWSQESGMRFLSKTLKKKKSIICCSIFGTSSFGLLNIFG